MELGSPLLTEIIVAGGLVLTQLFDDVGLLPSKLLELAAQQVVPRSWQHPGPIALASDRRPGSTVLRIWVSASTSAAGQGAEIIVSPIKRRKRHRLWTRQVSHCYSAVFVLR